MSKDPAHVRALREYVKGSLMGLEEVSAHDAELWGESDRAFAVLHAANLENALRDLFAFKFRPSLNSAERNAVYGPDGSMSSFAAKIGLAYALEYIGPITRDDMNLVRLVRNGFAHSGRALDFKLAVVADVCAHLQFPDLPTGYQLMGPLGRIASAEEADLTNPRNRYRITCQRVSFGLMLKRVKPSPLMDTIPSEPLL